MAYPHVHPFLNLFFPQVSCTFLRVFPLGNKRPTQLYIMSMLLLCITYIYIWRVHTDENTWIWDTLNSRWSNKCSSSRNWYLSSCIIWTCARVRELVGNENIGRMAQLLNYWGPWLLMGKGRDSFSFYGQGRAVERTTIGQGILLGCAKPSRAGQSIPPEVFSQNLKFNSNGNNYSLCPICSGLFLTY